MNLRYPSALESVCEYARLVHGVLAEVRVASSKEHASVEIARNGDVVHSVGGPKIDDVCEHMLVTLKAQYAQLQRQRETIRMVNT